jgi:hypothetical protein
MKSHDITEELEKLCNNSWISIELVDELIQAEKWNLWNKWTSHKSMIESLIKKYIN